MHKIDTDTDTNKGPGATHSYAHATTPRLSTGGLTGVSHRVTICTNAALVLNRE
jgi:hypothetical protein